MSLAAIGERWDGEALRRGARWFAAACACLPVAEVAERHSLVESLLAAVSSGSLAVPWLAWGLLAWMVAAACAAGWGIAALAPRERGWLFAACVAMHAAYALATGLGLAVLIAAGCFVVSGAALREARGDRGA